MNDAGRVAIVPKGDWNNSTEYEFLDTVFYNHTSWLAKKNSVNQAPSEDSEYWQLMTTAAVDSVMIGATETTDGAKGIVPQPLAGDNNKVLKGNGTWADYSSGIRISQAEYDELTQEEKNEGIYFIYDAPSFDGVYVFQTVEQMEQAIEDELVPTGATMMVDEDTPYVINAEDITYDNSESGLEANTMQTAIDEIDTNKSDVGTLGVFEPTSTAAYAHAVGEYFMWVGQFVKVTAAIAVGDTIAIGTNVAATNVAAVLSELNSNISDITDYQSLTDSIDRISGSTTIHSKYGYRYGNRVKIQVVASSAVNMSYNEGWFIVDLSKVPISHKYSHVGTIQLIENDVVKQPFFGQATVEQKTYGAITYATFFQELTSTVVAGTKVIFDYDFIIE